MRYLCIFLLLGLSRVSSGNLEDEKKRWAEIFGESDSVNTTFRKDSASELSQSETDRLNDLFKTPSSSTTTPRPSKGSDDAGECQTLEGKPGVCVPYYQCSSENGSVIKDGTTILDIRFGGVNCPHYMETCCLLEETHEKPSPSPPPVAEEAECGWSNPSAQDFRTRDDDNSTAVIGEFPWMVAILRRTDGDTTWVQGNYFGGGSIIHPSVVLTAAHKVDGKQARELKCRAGEWDTQTDYEFHPYQERNVKKVIKHPQFYRANTFNSIALLILDTPYDLSNAPHMGVACIAPHAPPAGTRCRSMGWGKYFNDKDKYAVVLKKVVLPALSHDKCQKEFRKTRLGAHFVLHPSLMCAGGEAGQDTCKGDGGSPLVCPIGDFDPNKEPPRFAIVGMVAWGLGCGDPVPAAYVNVPYFYDWIKDQMRAEGFGSSSFTYT